MCCAQLLLLYLPDEDLSGSKRCKIDEIDVASSYVCVFEDCLTIPVIVQSIPVSYSLRSEGPIVLGTLHVHM